MGILYESQALLRLAEIYSAVTGLPLRKVGRQAAGAHQFFVRLSQGRGCNTRTAQRVYAFFDEKWPPGVYWPSDIPRRGSKKMKVSVELKRWP